MQVPQIDAALPATLPTGSGVTARIVAGNLTGVPPGALLQATVTTVTPREAVLTVNGQTLTVRPPPGVQLQLGAILLVRVPNAATATNPALELSVPPNAAQGQQTAVASTAPQLPTGVSPRLAVVDVLNPLPDGRFRVRIDGEEQIATASLPLASGGRFVLQVARTPNGITLTQPPPDRPILSTEVATAILRVPAPTLAAAIKPLQAELAALGAQPTSGTDRPLPAPVRDAVAAVRDTLRMFLPVDSRPPDAKQLQQLVENGGLHFEAKLARLVMEPEAAQTNTGDTTATPATSAKASAGEASPVPREPATTSEPTPDRAVAPSTREFGPDLKGDLLRLLQTVQDLGGPARAPAAQAALAGIESQQAVNTLAMVNGTPYFLQVPFPDNGVWRTMHLSLEPQHQPDHPDAEHPGRFRVFMHVPLTDLGETWIDAGLAGDTFRATIYLDQPAVRDRVRVALDDLRTELQTGGFSEVLLDVRSSNELPERHRREAGEMQAGRPETVSVIDVRA